MNYRKRRQRRRREHAARGSFVWTDQVQAVKWTSKGLTAIARRPNEVTAAARATQAHPRRGLLFPHLHRRRWARKG